MLRQWLIQQRLGITIGVAITAATVLIHALGWTERMELQFYDALVRGFSTVPAGTAFSTSTSMTIPCNAMRAGRGLAMCKANC